MVVVVVDVVVASAVADLISDSCRGKGCVVFEWTCSELLTVQGYVYSDQQEQQQQHLPYPC